MVDEIILFKTSEVQKKTLFLLLSPPESGKAKWVHVIFTTSRTTVVPHLVAIYSLFEMLLFFFRNSTFRSDTLDMLSAVGFLSE